MFFKKEKLNNVPREWHNPNPESMGSVVGEKHTVTNSYKTVIIQTKQGKFCVYLYKRDDSDIIAGVSNTIGWIGQSGPSITDTMQRAEELAAEFLPVEPPSPET